MFKLSSILKPRLDLALSNKTSISKSLSESAEANAAAVLQTLHTEEKGLNEGEAGNRLKQYGPNEIAKEKRKSVFVRLLSNFKNPLVILLLVLGFISYLTGDMRGTIMIFSHGAARGRPAFFPGTSF